MSGSQKHTWGVILNIVGGLLFVGGVALSFSIVGACLGVPMALVGLPLTIWGVVWTFQGKSQKQQEAIAAGVREGLQVRTSQDPAGAEPGKVLSAPTPAEDWEDEPAEGQEPGESSS